MGGGLNLYGFANGDPVNATDPFGLCPPEDKNVETCSSVEYWRDRASSSGSVAGKVGNSVMAGLADLGEQINATLHGESTGDCGTKYACGTPPAVGGPNPASAARLTTAEASDLAEWLGYAKRVKDAPINSMGQAVFTDGKNFITQDITMHQGVDATWKVFNSKWERIGTFTYDLLKRLGK